MMILPLGSCTISTAFFFVFHLGRSLKFEGKRAAPHYYLYDECEGALASFLKKSATAYQNQQCEGALASFVKWPK